MGKKNGSWLLNIVMNNFRFFVESEESDNLRDTLLKLPKKHQSLLLGFRLRLTANNTLDDDNQHVGIIQGKSITVAAPWKYSREMTLLHEVAHLVYGHLMSKDLKKEWSKIAKQNPNSNQDNAEEDFCMAYAAFYSDHPPKTYCCPAWNDFIKNKIHG